MSVLSRQPLKIFLTVSKLLIENEFNYRNPWEDVYENMSKLKDNAGWIGEKLDEDDMDFIPHLY